tara:strand:+ start:2570 stop:2731 length:162 start_codon:yes stop_codon:yes gene_type:complete
MLDTDPALKKEFEQQKELYKNFANDPDAILTWFYGKTKCYDERYLLYPIGREL